MILTHPLLQFALIALGLTIVIAWASGVPL